MVFGSFSPSTQALKSRDSPEVIVVDACGVVPAFGGSRVPVGGLRVVVVVVEPAGGSEVLVVVPGPGGVDPGGVVVAVGGASDTSVVALELPPGVSPFP